MSADTMSPLGRGDVVEIVMEMLKPIHTELKELRSGQSDMRVFVARLVGGWGGATIVIVCLWAGLQFFAAGGCNKVHISVDNPSGQSQNKTTASDPDTSAVNR